MNIFQLQVTYPFFVPINDPKMTPKPSWKIFYIIVCRLYYYCNFFLLRLKSGNFHQFQFCIIDHRSYLVFNHFVHLRSILTHDFMNSNTVCVHPCEKRTWQLLNLSLTAPFQTKFMTWAYCTYVSLANLCLVDITKHPKW